MTNDDFYDNIDWSEVEMPTPTVTPSSKRPRLDDVNNNGESSLLQNLEMAPTFGGDTLLMGDSKVEGEDEEVGDAMQVKAIELAIGGENLFLTGKAGTGKSWATKRILKRFEEDGKIIHLTAPTGIAAINIGGT